MHLNAKGRVFAYDQNNEKGVQGVSDVFCISENLSTKIVSQRWIFNTKSSYQRPNDHIATSHTSAEIQYVAVQFVSDESIKTPRHLEGE